MERLSVDAVETSDADEALGRRRLSDALGTTELACNYYRLGPTDRLPAGLHAHADQEEVFVVLEGDAVFETLDGEVTVSADEAIRFAPGEFQAGRNGGDEDLVVLALGSPRETEDVRIPFACPDCGHDDLRLDFDGELTFRCPACDVERAPAPCPACGGEDLAATLDDDGEAVVACSDCGADYERPPLRD